MDQSNGLRAGASMKIDDVRAEDAYITDENAVQQLLRSTSYSSSSTDQEFLKNPYASQRTTVVQALLTHQNI